MCADIRVTAARLPEFSSTWVVSSAAGDDGAPLTQGQGQAVRARAGVVGERLPDGRGMKHRPPGLPRAAASDRLASHHLAAASCARRL